MKICSENKGDRQLLKDEFLENEGDYFTINIYALLEATLNGEAIFKK